MRTQREGTSHWREPAEAPRQRTTVPSDNGREAPAPSRSWSSATAYSVVHRYNVRSKTHSRFHVRQTAGRTHMADGCKWRQVYENNPDGTRFSGNLNDLLRAVRAAADVHIKYRRPTEDGFIEWHRTAMHTSINPGGTRPPVVSCAFIDVPDTTNDAAGRRFITDPYALEWVIFNTSGVRHTSKFDARTRAIIGSPVADRLQIAWYVRGDNSFWWPPLAPLARLRGLSRPRATSA